MKCSKCSGAGYIYNNLVGYAEDCSVCHGKGEVQTNEEWVKSLDTEGLVDYLFEVHKGGSSVERQAWIEKHKERIKMQIRGWLKEIHDEM